MTTSSVDQTLHSASSFTGSIGVNTHVAYSWGSYSNLALVEDDLKYLGVTKLRDALATTPNSQPVMNGLAADGYKFDLIASSSMPASGSAGIADYLAQLDSFVKAHPGSLIAVEGLNEANSQPFTYNGSSDVSAAAKFQAALYTAIKGDATLSGVSVYNLSLSYNDAGDYAKLGNLSGSVDYANSHAYLGTSSSPQTVLNMLLSSATSVASGKPVVITETGYSTVTSAPYIGVDQTVQAKSILNTLVDAYKDGVATTYLYELLDHGSDAGSNMGLFNADGTPKIAATAIHNLTTILADSGTGGNTPTAQLGYSLSGLPASGNSMVLTKSNGAYDLVVWAEPKIWDDATDSEIAAPTTSVTVQLGGVHHSVVVYDPLSGTTPIATYTDVSQIVLPLSDHPLIIEIDAPANGGSSAPQALVNVSDTAADIVAELSDLNASTTLKTITLTDTHVLPVASETTMSYIISHYGNALAAIQGGYSFSVTTSSSTWSLTKVFNSSGTLVSTTTTNFSNGVATSKVTVNADGSTDSISYSSGLATQEVIVKANGTKETKKFGTDSKLLSDMVQNKDGSSSNTLYTAGVKTAYYVNNADGSHDNTFYNITGKTYVTETQHLDSTGKVTSITRTHTDGTLDYTQVKNSDGSSVTTLYDATGKKTTAVTVTSTTTTTDTFNTSGVLVKEVVQKTDGSVSTSNYNGTLLTSVYILGADGTKETKLYDSAGRLANDAVIKTNGSSSTTIYTAGVKTAYYVNNADGSHDNSFYNITGKTYVTESQHVDATGKVTSITRTHTDGTLDYTQVKNSDGSSVTTLYNSVGQKTTKITSTSTTTTTDTYNTSGVLLKEVVQKTDGSVVTSNYNGSLFVSVYILNADGSKETKLYDSLGRLSSDVVIKTDGSTSNTVYSAGVKTVLYVNNADGSHDNTYYNITGKTYVAETQHSDASGKVTAITRVHTDGTLDYTQVKNSDGSSLTTLYNATGQKTSTVAWTSTTTTTDTFSTTGALTKEVVQKTNGFVSTTNYNGALLASIYIVNADGSKETKLYDAAGVLANDSLIGTDGSTSTTVYSSGVKGALYVTNADGSHDNTFYNITGKSYVTESQHSTAAGVVTQVVRTHADGSLDYKQVVNSDGSKVTDVYDSTGHKLNEVQSHADGSSVTDIFNTSGAMTQELVKAANGDTTTTNYANGVQTSVYVVHTDGWKETKLFDASGNLANDTVYNTDGSTSSTVYSGGVKTASYVTNADGTHDNSFFNITGKSYVTEYQHTNAAGTVLSDIRLHADGTFDFKQITNSDGSKETDVYDSTGKEMQQTLKYADGSSDVFIFSVSGKPGAIEHDSRDASGALTKIDMQNADGTHTVTAVTSGQTLQGSASNDMFMVSPGSSTIVYNHGADTVVGFHAGTASNHDVIEISKSLVADYSHLQMTQNGSNATIQISATDTIVLQGVNIQNLDHGNFLFV